MLPGRSADGCVTEQVIFTEKKWQKSISANRANGKQPEDWHLCWQPNAEWLQTNTHTHTQQMVFLDSVSNFFPVAITKEWKHRHTKQPHSVDETHTHRWSWGFNTLLLDSQLSSDWSFLSAQSFNQAGSPKVHTLNYWKPSPREDKSRNHGQIPAESLQWGPVAPLTVQVFTTHSCHSNE